MAVLTATPGQVPEKHRRAGPSAHQTPGPAGAGLWQPANGTTNVGRLRGNGDDQKGTGSEHWRGRHARSGRLRRGPVRDRGLIWTRLWWFLSPPPTLQQILHVNHETA